MRQAAVPPVSGSRRVVGGGTVVGTNALTVLLANGYRLVAYGASLLLSIHKNTLFGKWPAMLDNGSAR